MEICPEHIAPCGLYCGVCKILLATQADNRLYLERLVRIYARRFPKMEGLPPEMLMCDGCLSTRRSVLCRQCSIRECIQNRGYQGCHECDEFPCSLIDEFPMPVGKKVILRAIPYWREHGTKEWVRAEEERYRCPECGRRLFRGARQCPGCKISVDVD